MANRSISVERLNIFQSATGFCYRKADDRGAAVRNLTADNARARTSSPSALSLVSVNLRPAQALVTASAGRSHCAPTLRLFLFFVLRRFCREPIHIQPNGYRLSCDSRLRMGGPMKLRIIAGRVALCSICLAAGVAFSPSALAGYRCTGWDYGQPNHPCIQWQFVSGPDDFTRPKISAGLKRPTPPALKLKRVCHGGTNTCVTRR